MSELFTSVDPVMSKKMFHHFLDAHNQNSNNLQINSSKQTETVREELNDLQQQFSSLIFELEQLKQARLVKQPVEEKQSLTNEQRRELLQNVSMLEQKVQLLQEQPAHNKQKVDLLNKRIMQIKQKLQ